MTTIKLNQDKLDPMHPNYNQQLANLAVSASIRGAKIKPEGDYVCYTFSPEKFSVAVLAAIEPLIDAIENYPTFLKVDPTDEVPVGIPESALLDEDGEAVRQKTWEEWKGGNFTFTELNGDFYLQSNAYGGDYLLPSQMEGCEYTDTLTLSKLVD